MKTNSRILVISLAANVFCGCKPSVDTTSKDMASARGSGGQNLRCGTILPSVQNAAIKSLGAMVKYAKSGGSNSMARTVSVGTVTMLENMMRHPTKPIHPVAFYAAVKDFETAANLQWASKTANGVSYYTTQNCTSYQCFGLFQVDVKIESAWNGGAFCQSNGLNLWSTTAGGPDFCAAQFWWTVAEGGHKCERLSTSRRNPCKDPNYTWSVSEVSKGRAAYVQAIQDGWDSNAWAEMYQNYERCYTDKTPLLQAIAAFRTQVGLASAIASKQEGDPETVTISVAKPTNERPSMSPEKLNTGETKDPSLMWKYQLITR